MTVETSELQRQLSRYVRQVRESREAITVCEGSEPVALLAPLPGGNGRATESEHAEIEAAVRAAGLLVSLPGAGLAKPHLPAPTIAGDGRSDIPDTVAWLRGQRKW